MPCAAARARARARRVVEPIRTGLSASFRGADDENSALLIVLSLRSTGSPARSVCRVRQICHRSERDLVAALERKDVSRLVWGRDCMAELLQNVPDFRHLLRVRNRKLAAPDEKRILQPNSYVAAHRRRLRCEGHLETAGRQDGPPVVVSKQPVCGLFHEHEILWLGADAAQDAEYRLHEEWRFNELFVDEVRQILEVSDIVAFVLEAR